MEVRRVAVLGAGTMGRGIAQVAAQAGFETTLRDVGQAILDAAIAAVTRNLDAAVAKGKLSQDQRADALGRLRPQTDLATAVRDADLVIEAVPEDLELKGRVLREVEAVAPPQAILATNTSSLSITKIATAVAQPQRVVGMHFFNPPHLLKLLEVVRGAQTSDATVETALAVARRMGKEPIVVQDAPGFASSRLGIALGLEAIRMVEAGVASAEDIDKAMELGYNHPMGPLKLTDLVGLDVRLAIAEHLHRTLGDRFQPPQLLRDMVAKGNLGRKTGRGFYTYPTA
jgi:3-hydroxybutyryl-CoA dehydrogenase